jgi:hypothetical protein
VGLLKVKSAKLKNQTRGYAGLCNDKWTTIYKHRESDVPINVYPRGWGGAYFWDFVIFTFHENS